MEQCHNCKQFFEVRDLMAVEVLPPEKTCMEETFLCAECVQTILATARDVRVEEVHDQEDRPL